MNYPTLNTIAVSRETLDVFGGYNHNLRIGEGEFYDMRNLTSSYYPLLSVRQKRGVYASPTAPGGMIAKDSLCYIDGGDFVMNEYRIHMNFSSDLPKQLISMGAYVIILPDKKYINTADITDYGNIEASVTTTSDVSFELCRIDGSAYSVTYRQSSEPENPDNMACWIDTSSEPHALKQYSAENSTWINVNSTYIKISSAGIGAAFAQYDGVTISGLSGTTLIQNGSAVTDADIATIDGSFVIWERGNDYIVIIGMLDTARTISNAVTVARKMPNMDFVTESGNRLWGCRYGVAANGDIVNEIYASKLGDFKNWNCFMGISTDSYVASCGTDGQFTGAVTHLGYPLFFKENYLHKIYGNVPSNFQVQTTVCRGVQKGSAKSLATVNEILFYKSKNGICVYDGSLPTEISGDLGETVYHAAVGAPCRNKYYVSMCDDGGEYSLFVYDTSRKMWHKEDSTHADDFCYCRNELYYTDHADNKIKTVFGSGTTDAEPVSWMAETGIIGADSPDRKYISRLNLRMSLGLEAVVRIFVQYNSSGKWEQSVVVRSYGTDTFTVCLNPRRCDHMRIRIEGEGEAKIYSITKAIMKGSDAR